MVLNGQDSECDKDKLTGVDSVPFNRNPNSDNELAIKKDIDDSLGEGTILRFDQSLQNYLEASVGKSVYFLAKYDRIQKTVISFVNFPNTGGYLLQQWFLKRKDKYNKGKTSSLKRSTRTNSPTTNTGATPMKSIGDLFMYIEKKRK